MGSSMMNLVLDASFATYAQDRQFDRGTTAAPL